MPAHEKYMELAMRLALKGKGATSPNPMVGAVLVKNNKIIGRGYHQKAGQSHAEIIALDAAGRDSRGATLYVTLEPCAHFGKTPPCVERIIQSGVRRVYAGMIDPNPLNNGRGIAILKEHKIKVEVGLLEEKLKEMNEVFVKYITKKIPFITVKVAQSLDGKIATENGDSKWITSDRSRAFAHRLRKDYDAIVVGVNTVLRDNPTLDPWFSKQAPAKVVVDSQLSTPQGANIFSRKSKVIIATLPSRPGQETENRNILKDKAVILEIKEKAGQVNLKDMMKKLAQLEIANVLVEGGGTLIGSLFDEGLVDKILFFMSPKIIGGKQSISSVMGKGVARVERAVKLRGIKLRRIGEDILIEAHIK